MAAPTVRGSTAAVAGLSTTSPSGTAIGDLVICYTFERLGAGSATTLTTQTGSGFVEVHNRFHNDGSTDGAHAVAYKIATAGGAQTYTPFSSSVGTETWTGCLVITTGTYNVAGLAAASAGSSQTTNAVPNPPQVTGLNSARDYLGIAISAWHLGSAATVAVTVPSGFDARGDISGSATAELACATDEFTGVTSIDPGTWGDDVAPNGTSSITVALVAMVASTLTAATGSFTLTGVAAGLAHGYAMPVTVGAFTLTGNAAGLLQTALLPADVGAFTETGQAAGLTHQAKLVAGTGSFTLTANDANLVYDPGDPPVLEAETGAFALTGFAVGPYVLTFVLTGQAANLAHGYRFVADVATFALSGQAASLVPARMLTAEVGTFSLTGNPAGLLAARLLTTSTGPFVLTGQTAGLFRGYRLAAETGAFGLAGIETGVLAARLLAAATGTISLTAADAGLIHGAPGTYTLIAESGPFALAGTLTSLLAQHRLALALGSFAATGQAAALRHQARLATDVGSVLLTGWAVDLLAVTQIPPADPQRTLPARSIPALFPIPRRRAEPVVFAASRGPAVFTAKKER